jgi:hypothetical protein
MDCVQPALIHEDAMMASVNEWIAKIIADGGD